MDSRFRNPHRAGLVAPQQEKLAALNTALMFGELTPEDDHAQAPGILVLRWGIPAATLRDCYTAAHEIMVGLVYPEIHEPPRLLPAAFYVVGVPLTGPFEGKAISLTTPKVAAIFETIVQTLDRYPLDWTVAFVNPWQFYQERELWCEPVGQNEMYE